MDRDSALKLLHEFTETESLRKHAYAVEAAMRAYAKKYGEDRPCAGQHAGGPQGPDAES